MDSSTIVEFQTFVRKPFLIQAVEITPENIAELAPLIGVLKQNPRRGPFIVIDNNKVPNIPKAYPGYWITRMDDRIRCYSKKVFSQEFVECTDALVDQVEAINARA